MVNRYPTTSEYTSMILRNALPLHAYRHPDDGSCCIMLTLRVCSEAPYGVATPWSSYTTPEVGKYLQNHPGRPPQPFVELRHPSELKLRPIHEQGRLLALEISIERWNQQRQLLPLICSQGTVRILVDARVRARRMLLDYGNQEHPPFQIVGGCWIP